jgi:uncharacterized coiled-coil DUF342 family protein
VPTPEERLEQRLAHLNERAEEIRQEADRLDERIQEAHEAQQALSETIRLAKEEMRQFARGEARKALRRQLDTIVQSLAVKE